MRRPEAYGAKLSITSSCSMSFHWCDAWRAYARYDNEDRPHMSLGCDAPARRVVEPADKRNVVALPRLGGLHHRYTRRAA